MTKDNFTRALIVWFLISLDIFLTGILIGFYSRNLVVAVIATAGLGLGNALLWPFLSKLGLARSLCEEAPSAYKDVRQVMRAQRELTRVVRRLQPVVSYKAG